MSLLFPNRERERERAPAENEFKSTQWGLATNGRQRLGSRLRGSGVCLGFYFAVPETFGRCAHSPCNYVRSFQA